MAINLNELSRDWVVELEYGGTKFTCDLWRLYEALLTTWNSTVGKPDQERVIGFSDVFTTHGLPTLPFGTIQALIDVLGKRIADLQKKSDTADTALTTPT